MSLTTRILVSVTLIGAFIGTAAGTYTKPRIAMSQHWHEAGPPPMGYLGEPRSHHILRHRNIKKPHIHARPHFHRRHS